MKQLNILKAYIKKYQQTKHTKEERKILDIIRFNKSMQNLWNISIINYKLVRTPTQP